MRYLFRKYANGSKSINEILLMRKYGSLQKMTLRFCSKLLPIFIKISSSLSHLWYFSVYFRNFMNSQLRWPKLYEMLIKIGRSYNKISTSFFEVINAFKCVGNISSMHLQPFAWATRLKFIDLLALHLNYHLRWNKAR